MKKLLLLSILIFTGLVAKETSAIAEKHHKSYLKNKSFIIAAEKQATASGRNVMRVTRKMVEGHEVIRGGCWDYLNASFTRAGYPKARRTIIFKSKKEGPYANVATLRPGDWIYHVNHSYHGVGHSGMFIDWVNRTKKIALMLSYAGENRKEPARYKKYDLSSTYNIMRAQ